MRNLGIMALAMVMTLALAATASAQPSGLYITPKIGYSYFKANADNATFSSNASKSVVPFGLAVGYDFKPAQDIPLRVELEYVYRGEQEMYNESGTFHLPATGITTDYSGRWNFGAQSLFINGYFDIHNSSPVTPYIGGGIGIARVSTDARLGLSNITGVTPPVADFEISGNSTKTNFAWNIGVGAAWQCSDNIALDLGYRYADFGKANPDIYSVYEVPNGFAGFYSVDNKVTAHEVMLGLRFTF